MSSYGGAHPGRRHPGEPDVSGDEQPEHKPQRRWPGPDDVHDEPGQQPPGRPGGRDASQPGRRPAPPPRPPQWPQQEPDDSGGDEAPEHTGPAHLGRTTETPPVGPAEAAAAAGRPPEPGGSGHDGPSGTAGHGQPAQRRRTESRSEAQQAADELIRRHSRPRPEDTEGPDSKPSREGKRAQRRTPRREHDSGPHRKPPRRKRVVLADPRAPVTALRTVVELEEQTSYGEMLIQGLVSNQLRLALSVVGVVVLLIGGLPALFLLVPSITQTSVVGVPLPWLLLGVLPYPLLVAAGFWYNRRAERHEQDFVDMVEN